MIESQIDKCKRLIADADAIIIGGGAGLSTAAGIEYSGSRFTDNFPDFIEKYGLTDMYSSMFYNFPTSEERWAYQSRHVKLNRLDPGATELYTTLCKGLKDKNYFVITTNGDGQFYESGFDPDRIFAVQGDYTKFQCPEPCHKKLYDNRDTIIKMVEEQKDFKVPTELIPNCPNCGKEMVLNLRIDSGFVEDETWHKGYENYKKFIAENGSKNILFIELGVGFNTPGIIKQPFEQMVQQSKKGHLIRFNMDYLQGYYDLGDKAVIIKGDIGEFIKKIV